MGVRAKFTVTSVTEYGHGSGKTIKMNPQYDPDLPEDQRFSKATPSGELTMWIDNPAAADQLQLGKAFYLDLTEVPRPTPAKVPEELPTETPVGVGA